MHTISSSFPALIPGYPVGRRIGPFLLLSGVAGFDSEGFPTSYARWEGALPHPALNMSSPDSWEAPLVMQATLAFRTLRAVMAEQGSGEDDLLFYGVYVRTIRDYPTLVRVRSALFKDGVTPPCTISQVPALPFPDAVAYFDAIGFVPDPVSGLTGRVVLESPRIGRSQPARYQLGSRVGPYLFFSGVVATEAAAKPPEIGNGGEETPSDERRGLAERLFDDPITRQTEEVCDTFAVMLEEQGGALADLARINVYLTEIRDLPAMERVLRRRLGGRMPAATVIEVESLARPDFVVEIEGVGYVGEPATRRDLDAAEAASWGVNPIAIRSGALVFVSGIVAFDRGLGAMIEGPRDLPGDGRALVETAIPAADARRPATAATAAQAWHILDRIGRTVGGLDRVAKLTAYLEDIGTLGALDAVIRGMFAPEGRPALTVFQPKRLPVPGARVMIEAVAEA